MKIVLVTVGSRGDVQPMVALALALQAGGHQTVLAGPPERAAWPESWGVIIRRSVAMSPPFWTVLTMSIA